MVFGTWHLPPISPYYYYHIFLFQLAGTNLRVYFPVKSMHELTLFTLHDILVLFIMSYSHYLCHFSPSWWSRSHKICIPKNPFKSVYCNINYPNILNISAGIQLHTYTYEKNHFSVELNPWPLVLHIIYVDNPYKHHTCGKLVGCLTYNNRITIWHLCM